MRRINTWARLADKSPEAFVKVAALNPQFVVESPPALEGQEQQRVSEELRHLRLVQTPVAGELGVSADAKSAKQDHRAELTEETLTALKRLSKLIHKRQGDQKNQGSPDEKKRRRAFSVYQNLSSPGTSGRYNGQEKGQFLDLFY